MTPAWLVFLNRPDFLRLLLQCFFPEAHPTPSPLPLDPIRGQVPREPECHKPSKLNTACLESEQKCSWMHRLNSSGVWKGVGGKLACLQPLTSRAGLPLLGPFSCVKEESLSAHI